MATYIFVYPFQVLSTNRALQSSAIAGSHLKDINIFRDITGVTSKGGLASMWRGIIPAFGALLFQSIPISLYKASCDQGFEKSTIFLPSTVISTLLANPFEMLSVRHQNVDFKRGNVFLDFLSMWKSERFRLFRTGYLHALFRNFIIFGTLLRQYDESSALPFYFVTAALASHPFEVLRCRQQWAAQSKELSKAAVGENPLKALSKVYTEEGLPALWRGSVPRAAAFFVFSLALEKIWASQAMNN